MRARERGRRLGRPKVEELPGFEQRFAGIFEQITSGEITHTQAAKELAISPGTLKRVLDGWTPLPSTFPDGFYNVDSLVEVPD